ncbi:MAG TPA: VWA domain-containing protein [Thermoanaerobaculia bacterium]|nr:VWA domain-containing protein [Thermoanaerobaculia bacterium]
MSPEPQEESRVAAPAPLLALLVLLSLAAGGGLAFAQDPAPPPGAATADAPPPAVPAAEAETTGDARKQRKREKLSRKEIESLVAALPPEHRQWLVEVDLLISEAERAAFLEIDQDYQRDAFIERFWRIRDPYPDSSRNEFRERWYERLSYATQVFGSVEDQRSRYLLLNGSPDARIEFSCTTVVYPLEVWYYRRSENVGHEFFLIFVRRYNMQRWTLWRPTDPTSDLFDFVGASGSGNFQDILQDIYTCRDGDIVAAAISRALSRPMEYDMLLAKIERPKENPSPEWVETFASYSTDLPEGAAELPGELTVRYPARHQTRTVVEGQVTLAVADVGTAELAEARSFNFLLTGEVLAPREEGQKLFESFRYRFDFPAAGIAGDQIPLLFERRLRPGSYRVVVKVEDLNSSRVYREEQELEVPLVATTANLPADSEDRRILEEAVATLGVDRTTLQIVEPQGYMHTGMVRFDTLTTGDEIAEVRFELDGDPLFRRRNPPFSVELDLGRVPRAQTLRVTAHDATGKEIASDELRLNAGRNIFAVRFVEPRPEGKVSGTVDVRLDVKTPEGALAERVELLYNESLLATLYQEPWDQKVTLPDTPELGYLQAVVYLPDGNSTSDLVYVNAPDYLENVEVQYVELYASVLDKQGRPQLDLERHEVAVLEDKLPQEIQRFERVSDLPVHVQVMIDVSASMAQDLVSTRDAALGFLQKAITSKDRAALVTFNDHPHLAVDFTNDITALAGGLAGLKAERGTALHDSLFFGLYLLNGIRGQRAILLLSDGKDESSRFNFEDTIEYARRAGVAIYAIGLSLDRRGGGQAKKALDQLAATTGGRSFFIDNADQLASVYEQIQAELRSRYLITYQSTNSRPDGQFRSVVVSTTRPAVQVKAISGYYP